MSNDAITLADLQKKARDCMTKQVWDYYACGADDQITTKMNTKAFNRLRILPRVMRDVSDVDTTVTLFGKKYPYPIGIAPSAMQKLAGGEGELDVAYAAASLCVNMTLSSQSTTRLEDVIKPLSDSTSTADFWFQIYLTTDLERSIPLIRRAEAAGYTALVLTVDTPVLGNRLNERKVPLALPPNLSLANLENPKEPRSSNKPTSNRLLMNARTSTEAQEILKAAGGATHNASLTWQTTIPFLRKVSSLQIILKGIMTPEDATLAMAHGADAIIVSNHGGRQLDSTPATIEVLADIAAAVQGRVPLIFDGGIRKGTDVFKALALGADFVLVGRPVLWGLAVERQKGVEAVLNILERELSRTMALSGVCRIKDIKKSFLGVSRKDGFGIARL